MNLTETLSNLVQQTAFFNLTWGNYIMIVVAFVFLYLAIRKGFEPLLLVPISFGMLLVKAVVRAACWHTFTNLMSGRSCRP